MVLARAVSAHRMVDKGVVARLMLMSSEPSDTLSTSMHTTAWCRTWVLYASMILSQSTCRHAVPTGRHATCSRPHECVVGPGMHTRWQTSYYGMVLCIAPIPVVRGRQLVACRDHCTLMEGYACAYHTVRYSTSML